MRKNLSKIDNWTQFTEEDFINYMLDNNIKEVVNDYNSTGLIYTIDNIGILVDIFAKNVLVGGII